MLITSLALIMVGMNVFKRVLLIIVQCVNLERPISVKFVLLRLIFLEEEHVHHVLKVVIFVQMVIPVILVVLVIYSEMAYVTKKLAMSLAK